MGVAPRNVEAAGGGGDTVAPGEYSHGAKGVSASRTATSQGPHSANGSGPPAPTFGKGTAGNGGERAGMRGRRLLRPPGIR